MKKAPSVNATVLVVSGHAATRLQIRRYLQAMGHRVLMAASAREGAEKDRRSLGNLLIVDTALPDMPAEELLDRINKNRRLMRDVVNTDVVPSILIAGSSERLDENRMKHLGVLARLNKPLNLKLMAQFVEKIVSGELQMERDRRINICVLDGETRARTYFSTLLEDQQIKVHAVADVAGLTALAGSTKLALLIVELVSLGDDPLSFLRLFRQAHPATEIIVCTAMQDHEVAETLSEVAVADIFTKPVDPSRLQARVQELVAAVHA